MATANPDARPISLKVNFTAYDEGNAAEMRQYVASMKRLLDLPVRLVHGGHYPSFGQDRMRAIIRAFLALFDR